MKINKKVLLAGLFVSGIVSAQEFYTCVPKKDWWDSMIKSNTLTQSDIKNIVKESIKEQKKEEWKLVANVAVVNERGKGLVNLSLGNYKLRLTKNNTVIAERIIEIKNVSSVYFDSVICKCEQEYDCDYMYLQDKNYKETIMLNSNRSDLLDSCHGYTGPMKVATIINLKKKIFASQVFGANEDSFGPFKGTYLEVYKKVED